MALEAKAKETFLQLLRQLNEQGQAVSASPSPTYAPKVFASHPKAAGVGKRHFQTAMQDLLGDGQIRIETTGPVSRQRSRLVIGGPV